MFKSCNFETTNKIYDQKTKKIPWFNLILKRPIRKKRGSNFLNIVFKFKKFAGYQNVRQKIWPRVQILKFRKNEQQLMKLYQLYDQKDLCLN